MDTAHKLAYDYALENGYKKLITMDADLSHDPVEIPKMIKILDENKFVIGSRYIEGGGDERSKLRILSSKIINFICRLILDKDIKDYTSSIFLMRKEVLNHGVPIAYGHGEFFIEFLYKIKKNGIKICELPYVQPPDAEGSKTASSILRFFTLGFGYLIRILITRFRKN